MEEPHEPRARVDPCVDTPRREGLTGTAPVDIYRRVLDADEITRAPDGHPLEEQPKWRRDFPVDAPQDQYVARRDFMKFMVLTSLAFTCGQFWIAARNFVRRRRGLPAVKRIASLGDVPVGGAVTFVYPEETDRCLLIRPREQELVAFSQQCTHLSCAVIPQAADDRLYCPCHEGAFDLRSGRPIGGPPSRPLPRILLSVRGGEIYATGIELRTL